MQHEIGKLKEAAQDLLKKAQECTIYSGQFPNENCWHCTAIRVLEIIEDNEKKENLSKE